MEQALQRVYHPREPPATLFIARGPYSLRVYLPTCDSISKTRNFLKITGKLLELLEAPGRPKIHFSGASSSFQEHQMIRQVPGAVVWLPGGFLELLEAPGEGPSSSPGASRRPEKIVFC